MNPTQIRRSIADVEQWLSHLEAKRAAHEAALNSALTVTHHFDPGAVRLARADLGAVEDQVRDLKDRQAALIAMLPSPAIVAKAEADCRMLRKSAAEASVVFDAAAAEYFVDLAKAEQTARRLAAARSAAREASASLADVAASAGLAVVVPVSPDLTAARANIAHLQALLIGEAAFGDVEHVTLINLNAARSTAEGVVD